MMGNGAQAKGTVGTSSNRRKRGHSPSTDESSTGHVSPDEQSNESPVQEPTLALVLKRLDTIAGEGRSERARMEKESKAEREQLRSALASMNSKQRALDNTDSAKRVVDILSDEEYIPPTPGPSRSASATATSATGSGHRLTARDLEATANPIQRLRDDRSSARTANGILRRVTASDAQLKKLKSGYHLTINDSALVQAEWPQLNVFRSASNTATYDTLSIYEFCSGYLVNVIDCLYDPRPDVDKALDYLLYLNDLLDDIPLAGWDAVRDAHGEVLRQIEQGRLLWDDRPARALAFSKAIRRAHLENTTVAKPASTGKVTDNKADKVVKKPCPEYQTSSCEFKNTHTSQGTSWLHSCATCWKVKRQRHSHPKTECNRQQSIDEKNKAKNG